MIFICVLQCSVKCGIGERKRKVKCVDHLKKHIPNKYCPRPVPAAVEKCDMGSCHTQWWVTAWSHQVSYLPSVVENYFEVINLLCKHK